MRKKIQVRLVIIFVLLAVFFLPAVQEQEKIVESVTVEMETVPIFAVDSKGEPVLDLKAADIELSVNNKKIEAFSFVRRSFFTAPGQKENLPREKEPLTGEKKTIVLLFDTAASKATSVMRMKTIAGQILDNSEKGSQFILLAAKPYKGLVYIGGPLTDREKISQLIKKEVTPTRNFRSAGGELESVYGKDGYTTPGGGRQGGGNDLEALYAALLAERSTNYMRYRSDSLARSFEELYYSLSTIKGTKFLYFFSEGFAGAVGSKFYGLMVKYFLKTGAVTFIINPAGGAGRDMESGESFLRSLAQLGGSKYIFGSSKTIARSIKNVHRAYYEIAFQVPEEFSGKNIFVTVKPLREDINIHTARLLEKSRDYAAMNQTEKQVLALNLITRNSIFNINLSFRDARVINAARNNGQIVYKCVVPDEFLFGRADLYKVSLTGNKQAPIMEVSSISPRSNELEISFQEREGYSDYFVLVGGDKRTALVKGIPNPEIEIGGVSFRDNFLHFKISGYLKKELEGKQLGLLKVTVVIQDGAEKLVYRDTKYLQVKKDVMEIAIPLKRLARGTYKVLILSNDLLTDREAKFLQAMNL